MSEAKPGLARDGTMQVTAKEGIGYLKSQGKDTLLKVQGLVDAQPTNKTEEVNASGDKETVSDGKKTDEGQKGENRKEKSPEPAAKKAKLAKDSTMAATAKEGKALLAGEKLGDTRQETATAAQKSKKTPIKKNSTIAKTMEEAKFVLDGEVDVNSGRKTRSQSRGGTTPKPAIKKAGTMQKTAKEGKEFLNRGKGKKGKASSAEPAAAEEEDEEAADDDNDNGESEEKSDS